jgi:hypothetical protein
MADRQNERGASRELQAAARRTLQTPEDKTSDILICVNQDELTSRANKENH